MKSVFMAELSRDEYQRRLTEDHAVVIVPVGAMEQHGYHLPLGVDHMMCTEICRRVAAKINAVVAPMISFGYKSQPRSGGGNFHCGNISLDGNTLSLVIRDILREIASHGAKKIAVIDGHYENGWFLTEGCELALREFRRDGYNDVKVLNMIYAAIIKPETLNKIYEDEYPGLDLEHAGILETSMMLYLYPELVRMDRVHDHGPAEFPDYDIYPPNRDWIPSSGALAPADRSSAEIGKLLVDEFVELVTNSLKQEFQ